jgi:hypothetical protein
LTTGGRIARLRNVYRREMSCQIVHDSLHSRAGWTQPYLLRVGSTLVGYGAIAVGGPWAGRPTVFEFFLLCEFRALATDLFNEFPKNKRRRSDRGANQ